MRGFRMSEKHVYAVKPFKSSIYDVIFLILSVLLTVAWTFILIFFLNPLENKLNPLNMFYLVVIYSVLIYIIIHSLLNIKRSHEFLYIYEDGFKLPKSKIDEFIRKTDSYIAFKDVLKHKYIWYGAGCILSLKNGKEILITPDICGFKGYMKICKILDKRNRSTNSPDMDIVKKWLETKKAGWKKREEERELFEEVKEKNSKFF
jgi:hypothetical protein